MHSTQGHASQTPFEARSRVGAHSSKLSAYTRNLAKSMGWVLFREWALFHGTTVHSEEITDSNFLKYLSVEAPHYNLVSFTSQANCM